MPETTIGRAYWQIFQEAIDIVIQLSLEIDRYDIALIDDSIRLLGLLGRLQPAQIEAIEKQLEGAFSHWIIILSQTNSFIQGSLRLMAEGKDTIRINQIKELINNANKETGELGENFIRRINGELINNIISLLSIVNNQGLKVVIASFLLKLRYCGVNINEAGKLDDVLANIQP